MTDIDGKTGKVLKTRTKGELEHAAENFPDVPMPIDSKFKTALFAETRYRHVRRAYTQYREAIDEAFKITVSVANLAEAKINLRVSLDKLSEADGIVEHHRDLRAKKRKQEIAEQDAATAKAEQRYDKIKNRKSKKEKSKKEKSNQYDDSLFTAEDRQFFDADRKTVRFEAGARKIRGGCQSVIDEMRASGDLTPAQEQQIEQLKQETEEKIELFRQHVFGIGGAT